MERQRRWYEKDKVVHNCANKLEKLEPHFQRQVSSYIMDELLNTPPYITMLEEQIIKLATNESTPKRRWYDFSQTVHIFMELLKNLSEEKARKICIQVITFIEDLAPTSQKSI